MRVSKQLLLAGLAAAVSTGAAEGAVVLTTNAVNSGAPGTDLVNPYTVSATDLIAGLLPSASTGNYNLETSAGLSALTNGSFALVTRNPPNPADPDGGGPLPAPSPVAEQTIRNASFATAGNTAGTSLTYTLPAASNITSIGVFGGWQDGGRDEQSYDVLYATSAAPGTFVLLASVDHNPGLTTATAANAIGTVNPNSNPSASSVIISDNSAPFLASNVVALRFDFTATENGYSGYAEIDVNGSAVPEPASVATLAVGGLALLGRRRRH